MAKKCKSCQKAAVGGFEDAPYTEIAAAIVGGYGAGMIDNFLKKNADGTAKTGMLAENDMARNGLLIAAGVALTAYMKDDVSKGVGIGLATYGGYQIIYSYMNAPTTVAGMNGMPYMPLQSIAGYNDLPGSYGYVQPMINATSDVERRMKIANDIENREVASMMQDNESEDFDFAP